MKLPLTNELYRPDECEPVDGWYQAANASNPRTSMKLIQQFAGSCDFVVDPFAGSGSSAFAARLLGVPFYGIEPDPALAVAAMVKACGEPRHAERLLQIEPSPVMGTLVETLDEVQRQCDPSDSVMVAALATICCIASERGRWLPQRLVEELERVPVAGGRVVCGYAEDAGAWKNLLIPAGRGAMYCSPPFDVTSPVLTVPELARTRLSRLLNDAGFDVRADRRGTRGTFLATAVPMLAQALQSLGSGTLLIEHEPDDQGHDATAELMVLADTMSERFVPRTVLRCGAFSARGMLSIAVIDLKIE